jgi:hypothetical protein
MEGQRMDDNMRKGQKLENYFRLKGYPDEIHHARLYYIEDDEFTRITNSTWDEILKEHNKTKKK